MSTNTIDNPKKVTTSTVAKMKQAGEKIAMITANIGKNGVRTYQSGCSG